MSARRRLSLRFCVVLLVGTGAIAASATARGGGSQTLTIWSYDNQNPGLKPVLTTLSKNFEASHPGVKINLVFKDFTTLTQTVARALQSGAGPDVTEGNQGFQTDGQLVHAKLIIPLDSYAKKYNWSRWYSAGTAAQFRWTPDGKHFGSGDLYGVGQTGQHIVLYYNSAKLKQVGINPKNAFGTLAGFESALATARAKLPKSDPVLMLGNKEGYEAAYVAMTLVGSLGDAALVRDWIFHKGNPSINTPKTVKAFSLLASWQRKGYLPNDVNALSWSDSAADFAKGQGLFYFEGSWDAAIVKAGLKSAAGAVAMPPGVAGGQHASIGSTSGPWHISSKTKDPDMAAAWLNYVISSPAAINLMYNQQQIPSILQAKAPTSDPFLNQMVGSWKVENAQNGLMLYADWASPTMLMTITQNLQKLLGGKSTPQNVAAALQSDWAKFNSTLH